MDSILTTIKKMLGIEADYKAFDIDLIVNINSALMTLNQLGIGPDSGFSITSDVEYWSDLLGSSTNLDGVKTYIYLKVKLIFDPPTNSAVIDAINRTISELEWRLMAQVDLSKSTTTTT